MNYENLMKRCIELARKAEGNVSPNPLVGCVILNAEGKIISEGVHKKFGENHAERDALLKLAEDEARGGTLIVNLEPCSHFGKTPPCADLIIERGLKKVIIGMKDPNPIVSGRGIEKLKSAGIEVVENVLEADCRKQNEIFIKDMTEHKIFVAIKTATTLDGKIATSSGSSKWITSAGARAEVLNIRRRYDCIMTTSSTILADNPTMKHKFKAVLDRTLKTDFNEASIYKDGKICVFYDEKILPSENLPPNISLIPCPLKNNRLDLKYVFEKLYSNGLKSVLIEAGGMLNGSATEFADKIYHFFAPKILGDNSGKSCYDFRRVENISEAEIFEIISVKAFPPDIMLELVKSGEGGNL